MNPLSTTERKALEDVHGIFKSMEKTSCDGSFDGAQLDSLKELLQQFSDSDRVELQKLAEIPKHLHPGMSLRHFCNFSVPVERVLGRNPTDPEFLIETQDKKNVCSEKLPLRVVVENLRSAFNVGSIFRSAEALGIEQIELVGYSPTPDNLSVQKASMGTSNFVNWRHHADLPNCLKTLKAEGYLCLALETSVGAQNIFEPLKGAPTALIFGNERFGLESSTLADCDEVRKIPLVGNKNSLNVANCMAIVAAEWSRQWHLN